LASSRLARPDDARLRAADDLAPGTSWILAERARGRVLSGDATAARELAELAVEAEPRDVEAWTVLGVVALRSGDAERAQQAYRTALEANPVHAVARAGLAATLAGDDAAREYERALAAYPRLLEAHLALADAQGGARGLQQLRQASGALPDSARLHAAVLERVLAAGDGAGAVQYLRETLAEPLARSAAVFALAGELPADRAEAAADLFEQGAAAHPADATLAVAHARFLRESGDPAAAEARLRPLAEASPDDLRLVNALALALVAQDRLDEGRALLDGLADESATARFNLAQVLLEAGRPRAAAEELAPDVGPDQQDPGVWATYGTALAGAGRVDEAREALDRALALDPDQDLARRTLQRLDQRSAIAPEGVEPLPADAQAAFDRGLTDLEQGRYGDAAVELRRAYDATPGDAPLLAFYLASALQRDGRIAEAVELYDVVLAAFPDSGTVLNNYGFAWLQLGRYDRALPTLRDAVAASPENARAHLNLGLTYYGLSRFADAVASWDRAVELDPSLEPAIRDSRERAERQLPDAP
jgi:Tfp pilus assembly protein PilF